MNNKFSLSGTQLKMIAMITMVIDHVGLILMDDFTPFRIIGRLSFPLFALLIAEGCYYTRNKKRYLGIIFLVGILYQAVEFAYVRSLHMNALITFTMSILVIYSIDYARKNPLGSFARLMPVLHVVAFGILTEVSPELIPVDPAFNYSFDYGFFGMVLPVVAYYYRDNKTKMIYSMGVVLLILGLRGFWTQLFGLLTIPLIWAYNGERGRLVSKPVMKYAVYVFYPLHICVLYVVALLIGK